MVQSSNDEMDQLFDQNSDPSYVTIIQTIFINTMTAPIERVRILLQTQNVIPRIRSGEVSRFTSVSNCFKRIYSDQGLRSFWRGNFSAILVSTLPHISSHHLPQAYSNDPGILLALISITVNLVSIGSQLSILTYPFDYARTRLATDVGRGNRDFKGLTNCLSTTASGPNGFLGLYKGFVPSIIGTLIFVGSITVGVRVLLELDQSYGEQSYANAKNVGMLLVPALFASYPFDTVKRRLQMQGDKPRESWIYRGTYDCLKQMIREEGVRSLYRGSGISIMGQIAAIYSFFLCDSLLKKYL